MKQDYGGLSYLPPHLTFIEKTHFVSTFTFLKGKKMIALNFDWLILTAFQTVMSYLIPRV